MYLEFFEEINNFTPKKRTNRFGESFSFIGEETPLSSKETAHAIKDSLKLRRTLLLAFVVLISLVIFVGKAFSLQIIQGAEHAAMSDGNRIRLVNVQAERGLIYDTEGKVLVRNKPSFIVDLNTSLCDRLDSEDSSFPSCAKVIEDVSAFIDIEVNEKIKELESGRLSVVLATDVDKQDLLPLEANLSRFPSVSITALPQRDYVFGTSMAHILGYVGFADTPFPTIEGKLGLEQSYNQLLSGFPGSRIVQADSSGQALTVISERKAVPGHTLKLNIHAGLQQKAHEVLQNAVNNEEGTAIAGAIVAQDPKTGGVLALASYPSFDPNELSGGISVARFNELFSDPNAPFFNRAIAATYPPASTFKMVLAAAALEEGTISKYTSIFDPGYIQVGSYRFNNWNLGGHGDVDIIRALQVSNDTFFYTVGGGYNGVKGLGIEAISSWANKFGFSRKLGIDLNGEVTGYMPDGESREWYLGDTYISSIGQGDVLATPLQVNALSMYFSNGGKIYKPTIVKEIDGISTARIEIISKDVVSHENYELVRQGMLKAVEPGGTGYPFFDFPQKHNGIRVAGKTGTAEFGARDNEDTHAWFTVFGPYDNSDASIVLTVFLEKGGSGSDDAAPLARELFDYWFENKQF
ncbi:MAG: penicillin-binding protein 2 [Patescibacteria group bacterium]